MRPARAPSAMAGFFSACSAAERGGKQGCGWHLSHSPGHDQYLPASSPQPCTGAHQQACDLEEVEGNNPTQLTPLSTSKQRPPVPRVDHSRTSRNPWRQLRKCPVKCFGKAFAKWFAYKGYKLNHSCLVNQLDQLFTIQKPSPFIWRFFITHLDV